MFKNHPGGTESVIALADRVRVHTTFDDGVERVEEYHATTGELLERRWLDKSSLGRSRSWEFEIGDEPEVARMIVAADRAAAGGKSGAAAGGGSGGGGAGGGGAGGGDLLLRESSGAPVVAKRDERDSWVWRIRNLPHPKEVYSVEVDADKSQLVVRTSNKKYFKRLDVPALVRASLPLSADAVSFDYAHNTLLIRYRKPDAVVEHEDANRRRLMMSKKGSTGKDGPLECRPS